VIDHLTRQPCTRQVRLDANCESYATSAVARLVSVLEDQAMSDEDACLVNAVHLALAEGCLRPRDREPLVDWLLRIGAVTTDQLTPDTLATLAECPTCSQELRQ